MDLSVVDCSNQRIDVHVTGDQNSSGIAELARFRQELASCELGHPLIGENHRDLCVSEKLHCLGGIVAHHHVKVIFQQSLDRFQNLGLIVHHQHPWLIELLRHASPLSEVGIFKTNSVPSPGSLEN